MPYEPASAAAACSWVGLFAAVWSARDAVRLTASQETSPTTHPPHPRRVNEGGTTGNRGERHLAASRTDDPVAHPIDAPRRLDATIGSVRARLEALPKPDLLGRRSILVRAQLERLHRDAVQARARLATGTYGVCSQCSSPISLATLSQKPWTPVCGHCALDR